MLIYKKGAPLKRSSILTRAVAGLLLATSGFLATSHLLAQTTAPAATTAPATTQKVLAVINKQSIDADKFNQLLMSIGGMRLFEQVVDLVIAEQACNVAGVDVNAPEFQKNIQAELDRNLNELGNQGVPKEQRQQALQQLLQRQNISLPEYQMTLRKAACLRVLAKGKVTITDTNLAEAFEAEYGERVRGRLLSVKTMEDAAEVRKAIEKEAKDPAEVANMRQIPMRSIIIPKSVNVEKNLKTLKDIAFELKERQLSAALPQPDGTYLLFYLDKKEPQQDVKLTDVKEKLREKLTEQGEINWANNHLAWLRRQADIQVNDPVLSLQYAELIQRQKAAATQNATQPATAAAATQNK